MIAGSEREIRTAVVSGAANGIGRSLAFALADKGYSLILIDRDLAGLTAIKNDLSKRNEIRIFESDMADAASVKAVATDIRRVAPKVHVLINNAGIALHGRFDECDLEQIEFVVQVNLLGAMRLTFHLLEGVKAGRGTIVNMSSVFGLVAPVGQSAYSASKFGLRGFSESLGHELDSHGVRILTVYPAGTRTDIARRAYSGAGVSPETRAAQEARFTRHATLDPDEVARAIVRAIARGRSRLIIGRDAKWADILQRLAPSGYGAIANLVAAFAARVTSRK